MFKELRRFLFQRLKKDRLTLRRSKCAFLLNSVCYVGHLVDGLHKKNKMFKQAFMLTNGQIHAKIRSNAWELQSLLGKNNYYHSLFYQLPSVTAPFRVVFWDCQILSGLTNELKEILKIKGCCFINVQPLAIPRQLGR